MLSHPSEGTHDKTWRKVPVSITLTRTGVHPGVPDISESAEDLCLDAYPASITLSTNTSMIHGRPLEHLQKTEEVLQRYFKKPSRQTKKTRTSHTTW